MIFRRYAIIPVLNRGHITLLVWLRQANPNSGSMVTVDNDNRQKTTLSRTGLSGQQSGAPSQDTLVTASGEVNRRTAAVSVVRPQRRPRNEFIPFFHDSSR